MLYDTGIDGANEVDQGQSNTTPQGAILWNFLYNPQALAYSREANYSESNPLGSAVAYQHYINTSGRTLQLSNILLNSWYEGKSVQPLIDGIQALMQAQIGAGAFTPPPVLSFVWGSKTFGPCVIKSVQWQETGWLSGAPAYGAMNITLLEVREEQVSGNSFDQQLLDDEVVPGDGSPTESLTDSQAGQASRYAKAYLENNPQLWGPDVQTLIDSDSYLLLTNRETGDVQMLDSDRNVIGTILRSNGIFTEPDGTLSSGTLTTITTGTDVTLEEKLAFNDLIPAEPDEVPGLVIPVEAP